MGQTQLPIVVLAGRYGRDDGYARIAKNLLAGLIESGAPVAAYDIDARAIVGSPGPSLVGLRKRGETVEIYSEDADRPLAAIITERPDVIRNFGASGQSFLIGQTIYELADLPYGWASSLQSCDEVWVPTDFNASGFESAGLPGSMVRVMPYGVHALSELPQPGAGGERILTIVSSPDRRDIDQVVRAYLRVYGSDAGASLRIKARESEQTMAWITDRVENAAMAVGASPEARESIEIVTGHMSESEMHSLYRWASLYVSAERASGWDYPSMEAMALGCLVVGPDFGGRTAFATSMNSVLVPVGPGLEVMPRFGWNANPLHYRGQVWPRIEDEAYSAALQSVKDADEAQRAELREKAYETVVSRFSTESMTLRVLDRIRELRASDFRSHLSGSLTHDPALVDSWTEIRPSEADVQQLYLGAALESLGAAHLTDVKGIKRSYDAASAALQGLPSSERGPIEDALATARKTRRDHRVLKAGRVAKVVAATRWYGTGPSTESLASTVSSMRADGVVEGADSSAFDRASYDAAMRRWGGIPLSPSDRAKLESLRNRFSGERIFILGNGPSLNRLSLDLLEDEFTFGVNHIHLLFDRVSWRPSFFTVMDWRVGPQVAEHQDVLDARTTKLIPYRFRRLFDETPETYHFSAARVGRLAQDQFSADATRGVPSRGSVLITAIQLAAHMGFRDQYLIGVDASYQIPESVTQSGIDQFGTGNLLELESTADDDANHFDPRYFGAGAQWSDPNIDEMKRMFRMVGRGMERWGGKLWNATAGGELDELDRVDFESLF